MEPWKSLLSSTIVIRALDLGAICSSKSSKYLSILFLFPLWIFPSISHFSTNSMPVSQDHWHYWVDLGKELPPFPSISWHSPLNHCHLSSQEQVPFWFMQSGPYSQIDNPIKSNGNPVIHMEVLWNFDLISMQYSLTVL